MTKPKRIYERTFLNKEGQARATATVEYDYSFVQAEWALADCNRQIALDFSVYLSDNRKVSDKRLANRLKKITVLENQLALIKQGLQEQYEYYWTEVEPKQVKKPRRRLKLPTPLDFS